jgi:hypothetical protein
MAVAALETMAAAGEEAQENAIFSLLSASVPVGGPEEATRARYGTHNTTSQ